ncbi:hypothetical protein MOK15_19675 [Sphingobium sp. BYY-5]|uniref:helix-turn-helix transcriptional regulator n=1 Tax=Sphingobium sp. BYY-5 TaxID=2926400 RepID=UPI001FA6BB89|nr:hypothetical protein [Sphingobium sp. BYY-5]MCI4592300.1 hypothetical protein [Sphingobium sp. BYY-5]
MASVANEAIRRMNFGWLTLDASGRILNSHADETSLLGHTGPLLRGRDGRLTSADPQVAHEIVAAISASVKEDQPRPRAIVLSRDPWVDMLLVASSIGPTATGPAPALVAYIHADNWSSADRCDQLCQLFNLSQSEARLSLALSRGMSIAEAAVELGLTVESARTYSKRIYSKTGTRGQTDLIGLIHRSVLPFA